MPKNRLPTMTSVVITGRLMKSVVKFIGRKPVGDRREVGGGASVPHGRYGSGHTERGVGLLDGAATVREFASHPALELVEVRIEDRRHVERDDLRECETADDSDAEWAARCAGGTNANGDRERAGQRRHCGHHAG